MKIEIEWAPLTRARKIEGRIVIAVFWLMVPLSVFGGVHRWGATWNAAEYTLIALLFAVLMTALILRVERAQREQSERHQR